MDDKVIGSPERLVELSRYVPEFLRNYTELKELYGREEEELRLLYGHIDTLWTVSLIKEADLQGIIRYEKLLGMPSNNRLSLEERRANVLIKWNRLLPYTLRRLVEQLALWSGDEPFVVDTSRYKEYALRIEVFNQSQAALRGIKETAEEMIPANLLLYLFGRYPAEYEVPTHYDNAVHFQSDFHPRYNLPFLRLDRTWKLNHGRFLSGYDSGDILDFYPVKLLIRSGITTNIVTAQQMRTNWENRVAVTVENNLNLKTEAVQENRTAEQLKIRSCASEQAETHSELEYMAETRHVLQTGETLQCRSEAAETVQSQERFTLRNEAKQEIHTASYMTKMNQMNKEWKLDGSRKMDGGHYVL